MIRNIYTFLLSCSFLISCSNDPRVVQNFISEELLPVETISGAHLIQTIDGKIKFEIFANVIKRFQHVQPELVFSDSIIINFYNDSSLHVDAKLEADFAYVDNDERTMKASGNVVLKGKNNTIESDELIWDEESNIIYTKERVKITTKKEIIYGTGFTSDPSFSEYSISNIHGSVDFSHKK